MKKLIKRWLSKEEFESGEVYEEKTSNNHLFTLLKGKPFLKINYLKTKPKALKK